MSFNFMAAVTICSDFGFSSSLNYFANKGLSCQGYGFSSGHVWMGELDCEES